MILQLTKMNIRIIFLLHKFFGEDEKVRVWITTKNLNLGGFKPIDLMNNKRSHKVLAFMKDQNPEWVIE